MMSMNGKSLYEVPASSYVNALISLFLQSLDALELESP